MIELFKIYVDTSSDSPGDTYPVIPFRRMKLGFSVLMWDGESEKLSKLQGVWTRHYYRDADTKLLELYKHYLTREGKVLSKIPRGLQFRLIKFILSSFSKKP